MAFEEVEVHLFYHTPLLRIYGGEREILSYFLVIATGSSVMIPGAKLTLPCHSVRRQRELRGARVRWGSAGALGRGRPSRGP